MPVLETTRPSPKALSFEFLEAWPDPIAVALHGGVAFVNQSLVQYLGFRSARESAPKGSGWRSRRRRRP